jgi:hypothetical protein
METCCGEGKLTAEYTTHDLDRIRTIISQYARNVEYQVEHRRLDPLIAFLMYRRDIGYAILEMEECKVCQKDIRLSIDLDQHMIDSKRTRQAYTTSRWGALKLYFRLQMNMMKAIRKWVLTI